ncbi:MAG: hypothetical protein H0T85_09495 [Geodermatophilaceae bacterium]|nr:hypothetical protein [Geodermatophilaceae bacterium]
MTDDDAMRLYAQTPVRRTAQLAGDLALLAWCVGWILVGGFVHGLVGELAGPGRTIENAGRDFEGSMREVSAAVGDVPIAGDALQAPFETARGVGDTLIRAGQQQQDTVASIAFWLALVIALLPIAWALSRWLPRRVRWSREATAAGRLVGDTDLFALRALSRMSLPELARFGPNPAAAWRAGDDQVIRALAAAELSRLGLRVATAHRSGLA